MPYNKTKYLVLVQPTYDTKGSIFELQISFLGKSDKRSIIYETLEADETFGTIEAVKTSSDLLMPVAGTVIEFNEGLVDAYEKVNNDPYGEGWIIKVQVANPADLDNLLSAEAYKELIG